MKKILKALTISLIAGISIFALSFFHPFLSVDNRLTDFLYSRLRTPNKDIMLICIDEDTLDAYGSFTSWSRDKIADTINYLYSEEDKKPLAVGVDITFQGESNSDVDDKLVEACSGNRNIVVSSSIVFKGKVEKLDENSVNYNSYNIDYIEYPFPALKKNVSCGFTNAFLSGDSINRFSKCSFDFNGETINSFNYELAKIYANDRGLVIPNIKSDNEGIFRFFYSGKAKEYSHISLKTILDGNVPPSEFNNKIVLIGAYANGMQDSYFVPADIGGNMYGVEIQANIIQAILDGATATSIKPLNYGIFAGIVAFALCFVILIIDNIVFSSLLSVVSIIGHLFGGIILAKNGILIRQIYFVFVFVVLIIYIIIEKFVKERKRRKQITSTFSRYMDPKIVNKLAKDNQNTINLLGEKRDVSVLFVDIRGFTKMSESMEPEDVVSILNEYLGLVTDCIFKHGGMLDKFIGDAAMAIFNAPTDQDDYIFESVATAYDIAKGSEELSKKLLEKYGKTVSYGVGVHCGKAVIGNIGCKTRLDYTAIGDTVNTSSRIEGKAQKGEVLLSKEVREALGDRIVVEDAGFLELKGKTEPVNVFRLIDIERNSKSPIS